MKKISILSVACLLLMGWGFLCMAQSTKPDAKKLWTMITKESPYNQWKFWSDHKDMQPGKAPHGPFHKVYVNEVGLSSENTPMKDGSIVIKENYSKRKKLTGLTVMYKVKGFNPAGGDWFWAKYDKKGRAGASGKVKGCIQCHSVRSKNDYIFVHSF